MYVCVRVFNAPPTLNFILHRGAARYTTPCDENYESFARYFSRVLDTIFHRGGKQIGGPRKSFDSRGATENRKRETTERVTQETRRRSEVLALTSERGVATLFAQHFH